MPKRLGGMPPGKGLRNTISHVVLRSKQGKTISLMLTVNFWDHGQWVNR